MLYKLIFRLFLFLPIIGLSSCGKGIKEEVPLNEISLIPEVSRFDRDLYLATIELRKDTSLSDMAIYSKFLKGNRDFIVDWYYGGWDSIATDSQISVDFCRFFLRDPHVWELLDSVEANFPESFPFQKRFTNPLKRYSFYFPTEPVPKINTYVSGYLPSVASGTDEIFVSETQIAFGLHFYLGKNCKWYPPDIPIYIRRRFSETFLEIHLFRALAKRLSPPVNPVEKNTLLNEMLKAGITLYFLQKMLPDVPDSNLIFYDAVQWDWAEFYEGRIYRSLLPHLYKKDPGTLQSYLGESPYTPGHSIESAPRIGEYCGWKMVQAYMKNNPQIKLPALMQSPDYEAILKGSKYKPKDR